MIDSFSEHKEPEETFAVLSEKRYSDFYSMEMDGFTLDIPFYKKHCTEGSNILELGCGTGRISNALAVSGYRVTGIDFSTAMLRQAMEHHSPAPSYICMDARAIAFQGTFDHILLPYNMLNLLRYTKCIEKCLQQSHQYLNPDGSILLQIHIPDKKLIAAKGHKIFQFQTLTLPKNTGTLIKETFRSYCNTTQEIRMEERYRFRPIDLRAKKDFVHILNLAAFSVERWVATLQGCGFNNINLFGGYDSHPFHLENDSTLFIKASPSSRKEKQKRQ